MIEKKKRTQMAFDIHPDIHKRVKIRAAIRGISINLWVARAINERLLKEEQYDKKSDMPEV